MTAIRQMRPIDIPAVVSIHLRSFPGFFLSFLGPAFLRLLYRSILNDNSGVALVVENAGGVVGFISGSTQPAGLYKRMLRKQLFGFAWASLAGLARKPVVLPRLLRAFKMPGRRFPNETCAMILSVAVDPERQSTGVGKSLVREFFKVASLRGSTSVILDTDAHGNDPINRFYQSLGFSIQRTFTTPEGREMNEYLIQF